MILTWTLMFQVWDIHNCVVVHSPVQFFVTPWTAACQASLSFTISWSFLRLMTNESVMPSDHCTLHHPFSSCHQSFPASGSFHISWLFTTGGQSTAALASASVLPMNIHGWFPLYWLFWSPYCPRDSQESFPAPQIKSISSSVLSLLYGPTLTSIHDYWKNLSFDSCVP